MPKIKWTMEKIRHFLKPDHAAFALTLPAFYLHELLAIGLWVFSLVYDFLETEGVVPKEIPALFCYSHNKISEREVDSLKDEDSGSAALVIFFLFVIFLLLLAHLGALDMGKLADILKNAASRTADLVESIISRVM